MKRTRGLLVLLAVAFTGCSQSVAASNVLHATLQDGDSVIVLANDPIAVEFECRVESDGNTDDQLRLYATVTSGVDDWVWLGVGDPSPRQATGSAGEEILLEEFLLNDPVDTFGEPSRTFAVGQPPDVSAVDPEPTEMHYFDLVFVMDGTATTCTISGLISSAA